MGGMRNIAALSLGLAVGLTLIALPRTSHACPG